MSFQAIKDITRIANIIRRRGGRKRPISRYEVEDVLQAINEVYAFQCVTPHVGEVEAYPDKLQEAKLENRD